LAGGTREAVLNIVVLLNSPEETQREYREGLLALEPSARVTVINDVDAIDPHIASMDILMTFGAFLRKRGDEIYRKATRLRWVQGLGTGIDNLLPGPGLRDDLPVTCIRGIHDGAVSEAAMAAMLALSRNIRLSIRNQEKHVWDRQPSQLLDGKTVGLLGVGLIALTLARQCKAFDMKVVGITGRSEKPANFDELRSRANLAVAVRDLDYLVVLVPADPQNLRIVDAPVLAAMKPSSYLINVARGGVVDEPALIAVLEQNRIAGAALDVFSEEPLPKDHRLWDLPNVLITPHTAGSNVDYVRKAMPIIGRNLAAFKTGNIAAMNGLVRTPVAAVS
jgi:D-2-hydroxyacid dehydrogenase (NADP+)